MDRTLLEHECAEVFEVVFKDFPLVHVVFHKLDRGKFEQDLSSTSGAPWVCDVDIVRIEMYFHMKYSSHSYGRRTG